MLVKQFLPIVELIMVSDRNMKIEKRKEEISYM